MEHITSYISVLQDTVGKLPVAPITRVVETLQNARLEGRKVFVMGNGGSASTANHFVCDLAKNTRHDSLPHFRVIGLTDNMAIFPAINIPPVNSSHMTRDMATPAKSPETQRRGVRTSHEIVSLYAFVIIVTGSWALLLSL